MNKNNTSEINLIKLSKIISNNLLSIILIFLIMLSCGFILNYSKISEVKYNVSISYSVLHYPKDVREICSNNFECLKTESSKYLYRLINNGWSLDPIGEKFFKTVNKPLEPEAYVKEFNDANDILTNEILEKTLYSIERIEKIFNTKIKEADEKKAIPSFFKEGFLSSFYQEYKDLQMVLGDLDVNIGKKAFYIGDVNISRIKIDFFQYMVPWLVYSFIISLILIFIKYNSTNLKKKKPK